MNKKAGITLNITLIILIILVLIGLITSVYFILILKANDKNNPQLNMSQSDKPKLTINQSNLENITINETVIVFILYTLEIDRLHNPPLSSNTPKLEVSVDNEVFSAEIKNGNIKIGREQLENKDLIIYFPRKEVIRVLNSTNPALVVEESVKSGKARIEVVADSFTLFSKGYLNLYNKFTGKTI